MAIRRSRSGSGSAPASGAGPDDLGYPATPADGGVGSVGDVLAQVARGGNYPKLLAQLAAALVRSARGVSSAAITSGRWLADVVVDAAPRIPVRDLATLQAHYPGLEGDDLADALVRSASRATATVGVAGGSLTAIKWTVPVTLITIPIQLVVETAAVAAIEIKLVAELHEAYGVPVHGTATERGTAYALAWADRRGVNPLEPATITAALGVVARRRVQRRLAIRAGREIGTLAPMMAGAVYGAWSNRRQTLIMADSLRGDLRRRRRSDGVTSSVRNARVALALSRAMTPAASRGVSRLVQLSRRHDRP